MPEKPSSIKNIGRLSDSKESQQALSLEAPKVAKWMEGLEPEMVCLFNGPWERDLIVSLAMRVGPKGRVIVLEDTHQDAELDPSILQKFPQILTPHKSLSEWTERTAFSDFTLSLLELEFSRELETDFDRLFHLTKAGGQICCGELDNAHLNHYPLAFHLEKQIEEMVLKSKEARLWDPQVGRKLYQLFSESDCPEVSVEVLPHHVLFGFSEPEDVKDWSRRLDYLQSALDRGLIELSFDFKVFRREFFSFFDNPNRFSYSPMITISARKRA